MLHKTGNSDYFQRNICVSPTQNAVQKITWQIIPVLCNKLLHASETGWILLTFRGLMRLLSHVSLYFMSSYTLIHVRIDDLYASTLFIADVVRLSTLVFSRHDVAIKPILLIKAIAEGTRCINSSICYTIDDVRIFRIHVKLCHYIGFIHYLLKLR